MKVKNPILRGFYPDPSIVRVGDDYYIANSTFEWWPGVSLHHSRDLVHWEKLPSPLNRQSQLDLRCVGASQGIWAPCLTYDNGTFYLVYTVVKSFYCNMYDTANFLVTATDILGPWSEPIALNNFGFDPSLFHDDDGRKYMVSMVTDHRVPKKYVGRLVLQEYDDEQKKMVGPVREIFCADKVYLECPHIFKRKDWYYLFAADTGTGELHGQSILRSKNVWGSYEWYEGNSILTAREHPDFLLQKSGHCDLVETQNGEWYAVHLCGRALENRNPMDAPRFAGARRYTLGRETCIQKMKWTKDDWLVLANGTTLPDLETEVPDELADKAQAEQKNQQKQPPKRATSGIFAILTTSLVGCLTGTALRILCQRGEVKFDTTVIVCGIVLWKCAVIADMLRIIALNDTEVNACFCIILVGTVWCHLCTICSNCVLSVYSRKGTCLTVEKQRHLC